MTEEEALEALDIMMTEGAFGVAGTEVVIEEFLAGEEASFFALIDGRSALPLAAAQDHKRAYDGDKGPNTGGMGAYSPTPLVDDAMTQRIMREIVEPTATGMAAEGMPFRGVLFVGLMIDPDKGPRVVEYNVRFGDPECQALMMRLMSDLLPALIATADGTLAHMALRWHAETAMTVVMASKGYPGSYEKGSVILGVENVAEGSDAMIFHAGTDRRADGALIASGGRVLAITALGEDVRTARDRAYARIQGIDWPAGFCRSDIGWRRL